jgi:hypothetical protein
MPTQQKPQTASGMGEALPNAAHQPELDLNCPPIVPLWPKPGTMPERLLKLLLEHGPQTIDSFYAATGSHEIRKFASMLRDLGWTVNTYSTNAPDQYRLRRTLGHYHLDLSNTDLEGARP